MRKKKIIEAAVKQLEKENARRGTLMVATPDGRLVDSASTFTYNQDGTVTFETMANAVEDLGVSFQQMANAAEDLGKALAAVPVENSGKGLTALPNDIYADTILSPNFLKGWHEAKDDTPKEFHPLLCTRCGGNLVFRNKFLVCEYCGTMYSSDISISEKPQECYEPESKCANCGHGINATTLDDSKQVYICGSMNGCIYEEE